MRALAYLGCGLLATGACSSTAEGDDSSSSGADLGETAGTEEESGEEDSSGSEDSTTGTPKLDVSGKLDVGEEGGDGIPTTCDEAEKGSSTVVVSYLLIIVLGYYITFLFYYLPK